MIYPSSYLTSMTSLPIYTEYSSVDARTEPIHTHEFLELGIVLEGHGIHCYPGGEKLLAPGDAFIIPTGAAHGFRTKERFRLQNVFLFPRLMLDYSMQHGESSLPYVLLRFATGQETEVQNFHLDEPTMTVVQQLLHAAGSPTAEGPLSGTVQSSCLLAIVCVALQQSAYIQRALQQRISDRLCLVFQEINQNIASPSREVIGIVAEKLGLNAQYVNRLMKRETGETLSALIGRIKIEKSCALLMGGISVSETAQMLGYYDHSHFNKYFIRQLGMPPTEYQRRYCGTPRSRSR